MGILTMRVAIPNYALIPDFIERAALNFTTWSISQMQSVLDLAARTRGWRVNSVSRERVNDSEYILRLDVLKVA